MVSYINIVPLSCVFAYRRIYFSFFYTLYKDCSPAGYTPPTCVVRMARYAGTYSIKNTAVGVWCPSTVPETRSRGFFIGIILSRGVSLAVTGDSVGNDQTYLRDGGVWAEVETERFVFGVGNENNKTANLTPFYRVCVYIYKIEYYGRSVKSRSTSIPAYLLVSVFPSCLRSLFPCFVICYASSPGNPFSDNDPKTVDW